ncbi:PLP-dependent aminotransferase family protein [Bacillus sp. JRC01]|nr:PLP-dependent aminotransferase family protein [Bacillus sp. JRC01]
MDWKPNRHAVISIHRQITDQIKALIERGDWSTDMRIPPQRKLAEEFGVNRSTIQTALDELKADGYLEGRVGSGIYVTGNAWNFLMDQARPNWQRHIETGVHKPNYHTIQLINDYEQKDDIIRLGTGELSPDLLPAKELEESLRSITLDARAIGYSSPQGSIKLREALSARLDKRGITVSSDNILIVSGALQALQLIAVGLLEEGATVFQEGPSYLNSVHPFQSAGMRMQAVNRDGTLSSTIRSLKGQSLFYCVPTLNNPTGYSWTVEEKKSFYTLCRDAQIPIIEDDVYHELQFGEGSLSLKSMDEAGHVLYLGSVSKTLSPGLRIGWIVAPTPVIKRLADIKMQTDYGSSAFSQEIVAHWMTSGRYDRHVERLRTRLQERAERMEKILLRQYQDIATWNRPSGGFYIWIRFHAPIVNKALFLKALQRKVLLNPGYIYDPGDAHHIRLSFAYASLDEMEIGLHQLREIIKERRDAP